MADRKTLYLQFGELIGLKIKPQKTNFVQIKQARLVIKARFI
jgi:hypothetical protein